MSFDPNLPATRARIVSAELRSQLNALKALIDEAAPVGCVQAWLKDFPVVPALPSSWAECNGQVLDDSASPLNGQTLPNLNGANRFLRGAGSSGGTGGADTLTIASEVPVDNNIDGSSTTCISGPQPDLPTLPSYYEVVWVMRIK